MIMKNAPHRAGPDGWLVSGALLGWLLAACGTYPVDLGAWPPPDAGLDAPPITGACGPITKTLAHIPNLLGGPLDFDSANLYVVSSAGSDARGAQTLWQVPMSGAAPVALLTTDSSIGGINGYPELGAVWTTTGTAGGTNGAVWSYDGSHSTPFVLASARSSPGAIQLLGPNVYWAEQDVDSEGHPFAAIMWSADGGPAAIFQRMPIAETPRLFDASEYGDALFWSTAGVAQDTNGHAEVFEAFPPAPFTPTVLLAGDAGTIEMVTTDSGGDELLYSTEQGIRAVALDVIQSLDAGPPPSRLLVATNGVVEDIEQYGADFYFVDPGARELRMSTVEADGGSPPPRTVATNIDPSIVMQVDSACVYWVDPALAAVLMVSR
jgi:hypothetical protein